MKTETKKIKICIETEQKTKNGKTTSDVLQSIEEFDEQGRTLRHIFFDNGKIESLSISSYTKTASGIRGLEQKYNREGKITDVVKSRYDEKGRPFLERFWQNDIPTYRNIYHYDALGKLIEMAHFAYDGGEECTLRAKQTYTYNKKNRLTQEIWQHFDEKNPFKVCWDYEYDARGNKIRRFENGELHAESRFNEKNQETKEIGFSTSKQRRIVCYSTYNNQGKEISKRFIHFVENKKMREVIIFFRYDDYGNVVETKTKKWNEKRTEVEVRNFIYGYW
ncbi:MAG: hypothetical protein KGZ58_08520 [Ignavibacteriales bacterium]|nr:hypothetical protein [Ignavibacteriales bacterium]